MTTLTIASAVSAEEVALGPFQLGMSYDAWRDVVRAPTMKQVQAGMKSSDDGVMRQPRAGVNRAYRMASGGVIMVDLHHRRCRKHLKRVASQSSACSFWFAKTGHDKDYRLFEVSVQYNRPRGLTFDEIVAKYAERYGKAFSDKQYRQPASAPPTRALRWAFRADNLNYTVYLNGRADSNTPYRFSVSAKEPYIGGTRYGRHLRRTWVKRVVLD